MALIDARRLFFFAAAAHAELLDAATPAPPCRAVMMLIIFSLCRCRRAIAYVFALRCASRHYFFAPCRARLFRDADAIRCRAAFLRYAMAPDAASRRRC